MRIVKETTEDEMVQVFLKSELKSDRWKGFICCKLLEDEREASIILSPNLHDEDENDYRRSLLAYRGYPNRRLFKGFPKDSKWFRATLKYEDLLEVKVIRQDIWLQMSSYTRLAKDVARNIGCNMLNQKEAFHIIKVSELIKNGIELPEIILVIL